MASVDDPSAQPTSASLNAAIAEEEEETHAFEDLLEEFYSFTYDAAVLVGPSGVSPTKGKVSGRPKNTSGSPTRGSSPTREAGSTQRTSGLTQNATNAPGTSDMSTSAVLLSREVMDAMLPPKTWQDAQGKWQRMVSTLPSTRADAQRLQETFDQLMEQYQARAQAICPVREKFFLQVFEELIREVACECPERGLLLLRVRDELRLSVEAYQTLYQSSISYGRQKAVQADAGVGELEVEIRRLEMERETLAATKRELVHKLLFLEEQQGEEEKKRALRHAHTMQFLRTQQQELELFRREMTQDTPWK